MRRCIKLHNVTVHIPSETFGPHWQQYGDFQIQEGDASTIAIAPNTPFEVEADEAARLIARHGGEYCDEGES